MYATTCTCILSVNLLYFIEIIQYSMKSYHNNIHNTYYKLVHVIILCTCMSLMIVYCYYSYNNYYSCCFLESTLQEIQIQFNKASSLLKPIDTVNDSSHDKTLIQDGVTSCERLKPTLSECKDSQNLKTQLSVLQHKSQIIQMILDYRVVCIEGEAGCGKSTMVPQFILDSSSKYCKIIVCQPRRICAINLARHVSQQRRGQDGSVGFCVSGEKNVSINTSIVYCTTGYLLQVLFVDDCFFATLA